MTTTDPTDEIEVTARIFLRIADSDVDNTITEFPIHAMLAPDAPKPEGATITYSVRRLDLATELIRVAHQLLAEESAEEPEEGR